MKRMSGLLVAGALLILGVTWGLGRWDRAVSEREARYLVQTDAVLAATRPYHLQLEAYRLRARSAQLLADATRARLAATERDRDEAKKVPARVAEYIGILERRDSLWAEAYAALALRAVADSSRADLAENRAAVLQPVVEEGRQLHTCRVLFIKCPSRGTMFLAGVVAGAGAVLVTR